MVQLNHRWVWYSVCVRTKQHIHTIHVPYKPLSFIFYTLLMMNSVALCEYRRTSFCSLVRSFIHLASFNRPHAVSRECYPGHEKSNEKRENVAHHQMNVGCDGNYSRIRNQRCQMRGWNRSVKYGESLKMHKIVWVWMCDCEWKLLYDSYWSS